jgi:hypothetical protein
MPCLNTGEAKDSGKTAKNKKNIDARFSSAKLKSHGCALKQYLLL